MNTPTISRRMRGKVAIANAKLAYCLVAGIVASDRWQKLAAKGAQPQRLLWASTGVKDKAYPDTLYADALIGPDTVDTLPPATMDAFRDHGTVAQTLTADVDAARHVLAEAERLGLDLDGVTTQLVTDGVKLFADAADTLYGAVAAKRAQVSSATSSPQLDANLPDNLQQAVDARLKNATAERGAGASGRATHRCGPATTKPNGLAGWPRRRANRSISRAQGVGRRSAQISRCGAARHGRFQPWARGRSAGFLGNGAGSPRLHVLDTTDPGQIATVERQIDARNTLFIVSSKSGSTLEPELLARLLVRKGGPGRIALHRRY